MSFVFYILCKNEDANILKCIEALLKLEVDIIVLDSGSSDNTLEILKKYPVQVIHYPYIDHCQAYNDLTQNTLYDYCGIIDADMEVSKILFHELLSLAPNNDVVQCPIQMYVEGIEVKKGSLYPPKPIFFKRGKPYFEAVGHGEILKQGLKVSMTNSYLHHNDLKPFSSYLSTQLRYAEKFISRHYEKKLTWRDKIRQKSPILILLVPLYSLLFKGGIFYKSGWIYAIDRLIAEAIMYRRSLLDHLDKNKKK